ncbi:hypothetical protein I3843_15G098800 [Carya illinoinensis]|uniref:TIR domain-containing protein n=1 Tax=Carya illinoinensis TaxID=32201 RepID=A0A922A640_CARIL|nr:hypothetical protein I3842_15G106000 [Carya illinoinensis]KAG7944384.1 hypothetical protein I3843_15G098800 [Carya illinoinensis]
MARLDTMKIITGLIEWYVKNEKLRSKFAFSCNTPLLKILKCIMKTIKQIVLHVFSHIDLSDIRHQKGNFGEAFAKLKNRFECNEEVLKLLSGLMEPNKLSTFN